MNDELAGQIIDRLRSQGLFLAVAESLTGGDLSSRFVSIPGASDVFLGGVVAYQTELKNKWLGVDSELLERRGAVDPDVAKQMAAGVAKKTADALGIDRERIYALATTGVAGPTEQDGQPVGKVFVAIVRGDLSTVVELDHTGNRTEIRAQAALAALAALWEQIAQ
jgi:nicotinamide-nucleotide amidase